MEAITTLAGKVVDKLGAGMLAVITVVALFLGAGVYTFEVWNSSVDEPQATKSVGDISNMSEAVSGSSEASQTINF
jgi:hypothetical protein